MFASRCKFLMPTLIVHDQSRSKNPFVAVKEKVDLGFSGVSLECNSGLSCPSRCCTTMHSNPFSIRNGTAGSWGKYNFLMPSSLAETKAGSIPSAFTTSPSRDNAPIKAVFKWYFCLNHA